MPSFLESLVHKIAEKAKVTVLNIAKYKFEPQGFTLVALLAESHISFHTYPEKGIISFDFLYLWNSCSINCFRRYKKRN